MEGLQQSERTVARLNTFIDRLPRLPRLPLREGRSEQAGEIVARAHQDFETAMDDDLNVPGAIGVVFELIKQVNMMIDAGQLHAGDREAIFEFLQQADSVLGIMTKQLEKRQVVASLSSLSSSSSSSSSSSGSSSSSSSPIR